MRSWPHAPSKIVAGPGRYLITSATYRKQPFFNTHEKLEHLHDLLLEVAEKQGWKLQAWAVFANHYHLLGESPEKDHAVHELTRDVHRRSALYINKLDRAKGRIVWYRSWDTRITFEKSYFARLAYVHFNPIHHGLVAKAEDYPWCSARWFANGADKAFYESVCSFKTDQVKVVDDF